MSTSLKLPDNVSKEKDSVGVARVVECGPIRSTLDDGPEWTGVKLSPGDLLAYIPFTDAILMDGYEKLNLVPYRNIMAISQTGD